MRIIEPSYEILTPINGEEILKLLEFSGRVCYKSEDKITTDSAEKFIKMLLDHGHEAMIEHFNVTVKFIHNRGFTHELVRHRLCSFAQESTRYCNYSKDKFDNQITVINPYWFDDASIILQDGWYISVYMAESTYNVLLKGGLSPQAARGVLPNDLKTEIVITANLREWRHIFKLRTSAPAHPDMRRIMIPLLKEMQKKIPIIFDDITLGDENEKNNTRS